MSDDPWEDVREAIAVWREDHYSAPPKKIERLLSDADALLEVVPALADLIADYEELGGPDIFPDAHKAAREALAALPEHLK